MINEKILSTMPVNMLVALDPEIASVDKNHLSCLTRQAPHGIPYNYFHLQSLIPVSAANAGRICVERLQF